MSMPASMDVVLFLILISTSVFLFTVGTRKCFLKASLFIYLKPALESSMRFKSQGDNYRNTEAFDNFKIK